MRKIYRTPYSDETGICFVRLNVRGKPIWMHVDCNDDGMRQVGEQYGSKTELLTDHRDYLERAGWLKQAA